MARFSGRQYKGAERDMRAVRREEAEKRNAFTKPQRKRQYRRTVSAGQLARELASIRSRSRRGKRPVRQTPEVIDLTGPIKRHHN